MGMSGTPTPPVAPGVTPVFAKNLSCMKAPPPPAPCVPSPEPKIMARNSMPQASFTELVTQCLPHERPPGPVPAPMPDIRKPEILVTHRDEEKVHGVAFGDTKLDKIIFHTDASIGSFSLEQNRLVSKHKLAMTHLHCRIRRMAVNPVSGAIASLLEAPTRGDAQTDGPLETTIIVWPNGVLQEEPLKLRILPDAYATDFMPSAIVISASAEPQMVVSRVCTRKVFSWRFDSNASPMETTVATKGGLIAISSSGRWLAVVEEDDYRTHRTKVSSLDLMSFGTTHSTPSLIAILDRNPRTMAISHQGDTVLLALSDGCAVRPALPVEVFSIQPDGRASCTYRVVLESHCRLLSFCLSPNFIVCAREDGVVSLHNLLRGTAGMHRDDPKIRSVCVSANRQLILTAHDDVFHVYKAVQPAA